jgi:hypothetical protein
MQQITGKDLVTATDYIASNNMTGVLSLPETSFQSSLQTVGLQRTSPHTTPTGTSTFIFCVPFRVFLIIFKSISIIIAVVGVPGVLLGAALIEIPNFGRKWSMVSSSALMGTSLFLYATITTPAASVGFNAMEYFCKCLYLNFSCLA